ncbi:MAG TPA: CoA pyrophosphatase [Polyangiaceae bacterium]|nr:CoA pyrophosphatase [Polyangiaceae bacterium]
MPIDVDLVRAAFRGRAHRPATLRGDERFAAVAAILHDRNGEAEVLLIRRANKEGDPWSHHMAFPGGRQDPKDADLLHTALRETEEEVGLRLVPEQHLIGRLDDLPAIVRGNRVGLVIAPFVFAVEREPVLVPRVEEVEEVVWAQLSALAQGKLDTKYGYQLGGQTVELPGFDVGGRVVWGMTHRMLGALLAALDGRSRESYSDSK